MNSIHKVHSTLQYYHLQITARIMTSQVSLQNLPKIHKFLLTVCSPGLMRITEVSCGSFEGSSSQTSCPCLHSASSYKCEPPNILGWFFPCDPKLASLDNILAHLRRVPRDTPLRNAFSLLSYPWFLRSRHWSRLVCSSPSRTCLSLQGVSIVGSLR